MMMKRMITSYSSGVMSFLAFVIDKKILRAYLLEFNTLCIEKTLIVCFKSKV